VFAQQRALQEPVEHRALKERLNGLPNRSRFSSQGRTVDGRPAPATELARDLFVDLDRCKPSKKEYGHDAGNELLIADAATAVGREEGDVVGPPRGDEFVVPHRGSARTRARHRVASA